jgi:hypothetical protein
MVIRPGTNLVAPTENLERPVETNETRRHKKGKQTISDQNQQEGKSAEMVSGDEE